MVSTTINPGLEIWHLSWKDDSFRMAEWFEYQVSGPTLDNQITFYNGTVTTTGVYGTAPSAVLTNGDELTLPALNQSSEAIYIEKDFGTEATIIPIPPTAVTSINFRAKNIGTSNTLTITLVEAPSNLTILPAITIGSSEYQRYTLPIGSGAITHNITGIRLQVNTSSVILDYICFATCDFLNQGGMSLDITIPKKTVSQTIPNEADVIQQLGIGSRSKAVTIPKVSVAAYRWLEDKLENSTPLEVVSPTQQATGYLSDIQRNSSAGWVDIPLPTADALSAQSFIAQQAYDVSFTLAKADNEQNIDASVPTCPTTSLLIAPTQVSIQPVSMALSPIGSSINLEVSGFTAARSAKLVTYPRVQAYLDTSLVIGSFNTTYTLTTIVPQDFVHGEDIETLLAGLQYQYQLLTDAEGYGDYVMITQVSPSHTGGQPQFYSVDITATSLGMSLIAPTPPSPPPSPPTVVSEAGLIPYSPTKNIFWANGLWWMFTFDLTQLKIIYFTSSDGVTWSAPTIVTTSDVEGLMSLWQNGTTIYYSRGSSSTHFYWRYGTMNAGGTITWAISEASVGPTLATVYDTYISQDTSGNVWVLVSSSNGFTGHTEAWKYTGSWSSNTLATFSSQIGSMGVILPLLSGNMLAAYSKCFNGSSNVPITVQTWNGSSWSLATNTSHDYGSGFDTWGAVALGNTVYFVAINGAIEVPEFFTYIYGTGLSSPVALGAVGGIIYADISISGNTLVGFYSDGAKIYDIVSSNLGGTWPPVQTTLVSGLSSILTFASDYSVTGNIGGLAWFRNSIQEGFFTAVAI